MRSKMTRLFAAIGFIVALGACSGDSASTDDSIVSQIDTAAPSETSTSAAPNDAAVTTEAPEETIPDATSTTAGIAQAVALPPVDVLGVSSGAGGGEAFVTVREKPANWAKFSVSMSADGLDSARVKVLDVQSADAGVIIIVDATDFFGKAPLNVAVSWTDTSGVKSEIAYRTCSSGITSKGC